MWNTKPSRFLGHLAATSFGAAIDMCCILTGVAVTSLGLVIVAGSSEALVAGVKKGTANIVEVVKKTKDLA